MTRHHVRLLAVPILAFAISGCDNRFERDLLERYGAGPTAGSPAPEYAAVSLGGDTVRLDSFRGRVVLLNVWATWCKPCIAEFPDFVELERRLAPRGLVIVGVTIDHRPADQLRAFLVGHNVSWLTLKDSETNLNEVFGWGRGVPKSLLIDRTGHVVAFWWGQMNPLEGRNLELITRALENPSGRPASGGT